MAPSEADQSRRAKRIIVVAAHESEPLTSVSEALDDAEIKIESVAARRIGEWEVISLSSSDDDAALHALLEADLQALTSDAIVFHIPDRPGALAGVAQQLGGHQLQVRTIHIIQRLAGHAIVALATDDDDAARSLLDRDSLL